MVAVFVTLFTIIAVAFILAISGGGVHTPPPHKQTDKDTPEYLGYLD